MQVEMKQCDMIIFKDKNEFLTCLLNGGLKETLAYLENEQLFIHYNNWIMVLKKGVN